MIVSALIQEVVNLPQTVLITGVGKVNATMVLVDHIIKQSPKQIINYGTAAKCSRKVEVGKIYEIRKYSRTKRYERNTIRIRNLSNTFW